MAVAIAMVTVAPGPASAASPRPITRWAQHHAVPLATVDPNAVLDDHVPLRESVRGATIVGLGESVHGASEELTLKHRMLRFLVEDRGFRSVAWEEDWTTGVEIDAYIRTGAGDLDAIVREMSPQWHWREAVDVLRWLRQFNAGRDDQVRFIGVEHYFTRLLAYDALSGYVARVAPERSDELERHLRVIRPFTADEFAYLEWYQNQPDKAPFIRHAHAVHDLVRDLPHGRQLARRLVRHPRPPPARDPGRAGVTLGVASRRRRPVQFSGGLQAAGGVTPWCPVSRANRVTTF
jgi:hypothetical protein